MIAFEPAREADLPQLVELLALLFDQEAEFKPDAAKQAAALKLILSDPARGRIYVARDGRQVVAMASLLFTVSTAEGGKAAWFEDLVVRPEYRHQGTGEKMLAYVEHLFAGALVPVLTPHAKIHKPRAAAAPGQRRHAGQLCSGPAPG